MSQIPFFINTIDGGNGNIAHFFHEYLFHALDFFLSRDNVVWVLGTTLREWELQSVMLMIKHLGIPYTYTDLGKWRITSDYDIKKSKNFSKIMKLLGEAAAKEFPDVKYEGNYKVLYFRNDATKRRMVGYNGELDSYFDRVVTDMAALSFADQVKLFMKCSHLVTIEGAHLTNIVFMNENAKVLDITTVPNSWQVFYGTSKCVNHFEEFPINTINGTHSGVYAVNGTVQSGVVDDSLFTRDIPFSSLIETKIKEFTG